MPQLQSLKTRPEFLRLKKTRPVRLPAFILQGAARDLNSSPPLVSTLRSFASKARAGGGRGRGSTESQQNTPLSHASLRSHDSSPARGEPIPVRIGFIITKKIGNAVVRNRIRRRLKAALNFIANSDKEHLHAGWDYVVIPSILVLTMPYEDLVKTLENALTRLKP